MGNLLGSPVTTKETHTGETKAYDDKSPSLKFGLSSMQGWRVHMEDAHIAEGDLYAKLPAPATATAATLNNSDSNLLPVKGHSLFAVYDGHGGTFAAMYAGRNFLRILSKQPKWIEYAQLLKKEEEDEANLKQNENSSGSGDDKKKNEDGMDPKHRELIEAAMRQAFVETDYEIALAIRGSPHPDANEPYHKDAPHADGGGGDGTTDTNTDADDAQMSTSQDEGDSPDSPSHHHASATMEAASRAAADHVSALDDEGDSGTTACAVLITPTAILCANAGDSRAVYSCKGEAVALSYDHKPDDQPEEARIRAAGGYVAGGRVEGDLAVSRGLGDFRFKEMPTVMRNMDVTGPGGTSSGSYDPAAASEASGGDGETKASETTGGGDDTTMDGDDSAAAAFAEQHSSSSFKICPPGDQKVSPIPDFIVHPRDNENDEFVIVACDGIWDVRTNQDCVMEVATMFQEGETDLGLVSEELLDRCLHLGSKDNMTSIVIQMPGLKLPPAGTSNSNDTVGVTARRQKREKEAAGDEDHHHINMESDDDDDDDDAMWTQPHGNEELAAVFHEAQQESSSGEDSDDAKQ